MRIPRKRTYIVHVLHISQREQLLRPFNDLLAKCRGEVSFAGQILTWTILEEVLHHFDVWNRFQEPLPWHGFGLSLQLGSLSLRLGALSLRLGSLSLRLWWLCLRLWWLCLWLWWLWLWWAFCHLEGVGEMLGYLQVPHGLKCFLITCLYIHLLWWIRSLFLLFLFYFLLLFLLLALSSLDSDSSLRLTSRLGAFHGSNERNSKLFYNYIFPGFLRIELAE